MPRPKKNESNNSFLHAALEWFELQRQKLDGQISEVQAMLGLGEKKRGRPAGKRTSTRKAAAEVHRAPGKRTMSPAAKKRIAAAQKRRWAEYRKKVSAGKEA